MITGSAVLLWAVAEHRGGRMERNKTTLLVARTGKERRKRQVLATLEIMPDDPRPPLPHLPTIPPGAQPLPHGPVGALEIQTIA